MSTGRPKPSLWLELTPHCNLDCEFCYNPWRSKSKADYPKSASYDEYLDAVVRLSDRIKFGSVTLSGGEPMLYRHLGNLVEELANRDLPTILTTNGKLLTRSKIGDLTNRGLTAVQVPLLSVTPEIHDRLAKSSSWRRAVQALALAIEFGRQAVAVFVATSSNIDELPQVARLVAALGVSSIIINELQPVGSAAPVAQQLGVDPMRFAKTVSKVIDDSRDGALNIRVVRHASNIAAIAQDNVWTRWSLTTSAELKLCNMSSITLGRVATMSDSELDRLANDYAEGALSGLARFVDNCACFDRVYGVDRRVIKLDEMAGVPSM